MTLSVIGTEYVPGPTIVFPSGSSAMTFNVVVPAMPAVSGVPRKSWMVFTTPFSTAWIWNGVPATTVVIAVPAPSSVPVAFGPSY